MIGQGKEPGYEQKKGWDQPELRLNLSFLPPQKVQCRAAARLISVPLEGGHKNSYHPRLGEEYGPSWALGGAWLVPTIVPRVLPDITNDGMLGFLLPEEFHQKAPYTGSMSLELFLL